MTLSPRVVLVHRASEYTELVHRHGTRGQAQFFLSQRGLDLADVARRHQELERAITAVSAAVPVSWRRGSVERQDLAQFLFAPEDILVVVGQDGLVPNVAKYLAGQTVIGVNPGSEPGILVRHSPADAPELMLAAAGGGLAVQARTMVAATSDDGQELLALNEIYLGQVTHQTARYTLRSPSGAERQASSGVLVSTGTGATGWCGSAWLERHSELVLPQPTDRGLGWFVREAWPSPGTGTRLTQGVLHEDRLELQIESDSLVAFGDGMESDSITLTRGQQVRIEIADRTLNLAA
ncbi:hypothetical protein ABIB25_001079 [Nakamurella sp. UYEF19]|uniref:hypothetical protein n=1 Tax=Nakamurella sp. UYEF19 TaxID=1756392 RepID=UPI00339B745C